MFTREVLEYALLDLTRRLQASSARTLNHSCRQRVSSSMSSLAARYSCSCKLNLSEAQNSAQQCVNTLTDLNLLHRIYTLKDDANIGAGPLTPLGLFFVIFGIGCAFGFETGYAINLARDFGPRLVSYMIGYGTDVWTAGNYYFWVSYTTTQLYNYTILTTSTDPDGRTLPWLRLRRLPL